LFEGIAMDRPRNVPNVEPNGNTVVEQEFGALLDKACGVRKGWRARQDSNLWPSAPEALGDLERSQPTPEKWGRLSPRAAA